MSQGGEWDRLTDAVGIGVLTRVFDRDLVDEVIAVCGRTQRRRRLLPARVVLYYVLALTLFDSEAYEEVMRRLVHGLRGLGNWGREWAVPTDGAITQARARLGAEPLRELFVRRAVPLAGPGTRGAWYRGRRMVSFDGVVLNTPNSAANTAEFGRSGNDRAESPFPQVRVVTLVESGTHATIAAATAPINAGERSLTAQLLGALEPDMLLMCDRGFFSRALWNDAVATGADLLWRVTSQLILTPQIGLDDGSWLAVIRAPRKRGTPITVRVIEYRITDRGDKDEVFRLITTITDPAAAPAVELAALYHQRWEHELVFDELETCQMHDRVLRSGTPELIYQEIWAFLLTHYAIRAFIVEAADDIDDDPDRLSFLRSIRVIRRQVSDQAAFSPRNADHRDQ